MSSAPEPNRNQPPGAPPSGPPASSGLDDYNTIAETVGGLSLRKKDTLLQGLVVLIGTLLGAAVGVVFMLRDESDNGPPWWFYMVGCALVGLIVSAFLSGFVLMIVGWVRAAKRISGP